MNIKWKAIFSIMSITLVIWAALVYFIYQQGQKDLNRVVEARITSARDIAATMETGIYPSYQKRIRSLVNTETSPARRQMVQAFHERDKAKLLQVSKPFLNVLRNESPDFTSFAWVLPDNTAFLRVHRPELTGDDIGEMRPDIVAANTTKKQVSAYAISGVGLGYHVSQPVYWQGEYCGVVQWGIGISKMVDLLQERLKAPTAILIEEEKARYIKQYNIPYPIKKVTGYAIIAADPDAFPVGNPNIDWEIERSWHDTQDKHFAMVRLLALPDLNQQPTGYLIAKLDLSEEYIAVKARFWTVLATTSLLLLVIFVLLYTNFNHLLKEIFTLNRSLEQRVKERSAELQKSRDEWVAMFNAIPDMVTIQDKNMAITAANKAVYDFFQASEQELIGKHCYELFHHRNQRCPGCTKNECYDRGESYQKTIYSEKLKRVFQVTAAPIQKSGEEQDSFVQIIQDVTEKKELEDDLIQAQKMEAIGTLAGGIAHDFNNILSAIIGYATMARMREEEGSRLARDLDSILKASNRAADLVKQILTFSRKDASSEELFQPHLLLAEVSKMLRSSIPTTINIESNVDPNSGWIEASQVRIHQVIMNLCTNAAQAIGNAKGTLTIELKQQQVRREEITESDVVPGDFICLSVSDTGSGMDSETMERIFDPYFTTKTGEQGTGLGLAVVHGIVRELRGFIRVNSAPGQGTRFDIYLPKADIQVETTDHDNEEIYLPTGTEKILVVDDEEAITEITVETLKELGYQVTGMQDSSRALEELRQHPDRYALLISDQTMPEITGKELAAELRQLNPSIPVLLCTGYSADLQEQGPLPENIKKVMAKPLPLPELATTVREVLDAAD
ncbi:PAS domain S-box-containing protein [Malonomonas rubra DSM 5091]|uniref:histidine kinase n=1 Tax=Malonomonas rubra DSM 5091 TaxID=1122189 RepID=A0A1M6MMT3_MALRU|nr:ATP-binding protein [Malonomonas rubra]SHJ84696.1 PAS domain S-box-containing protein [Malonomonas rubra DSM 5091]